MIIDAKNKTIQEIISADNQSKCKFVIPKYQREYTWGKDQINQLFEDLIENDIGYFIGSYICMCLSSRKCIKGARKSA